MRFSWLVLLIPALLGIAATVTDYLPFKVGVPLCCALLLLVACGWRRQRTADTAFVIVAFVFSAIGDFFLSNKSGNETYFVIGIAAFFLAHLGYLSYALKNGRLHKVALAALLAGYLVYYVFALRTSIASPVLSMAVLMYLLISCFALAAALGLEDSGASKWLYAFGILMIVVSDTLISFNEFLKFRTFNQFILPTYYLAHLSITLALIGPRPIDLRSKDSTF